MTPMTFRGMSRLSMSLHVYLDQKVATSLRGIFPLSKVNRKCQTWRELGITVIQIDLSVPYQVTVTVAMAKEKSLK